MGFHSKQQRESLKLVEILRDKEPWYFSFRSPDLDIFSLTNAGTIGETDEGILKLIEKLRGCLKDGKIGIEERI